MPRLDMTWVRSGDAAGRPLPSTSANVCDNYERIPAVKTKYNGKWYQSKLEARVAEALDRMGIVWEYERAKFVGSQYQGGVYTPDFRLPNENIYIEAVGQMDVRHRLNAENFIAYESCVESLLMYGSYVPRPTSDHPAFCFVMGDGQIIDVNGANLVLLHCRSCNSWSVVREDGGWCCMHCGNYIGEGNRFGDNWGSNLLMAGAIADGRAV